MGVKVIRIEVEEQIKSLENMLYNATLITRKEKASSVIALGSSVTFIELPDGEEETYIIGGMEDSDSTEHIISSESPIAKNLLGHEENDVVSIHTPDGRVKIKITHVY